MSTNCFEHFLRERTRKVTYLEQVYQNLQISHERGKHELPQPRGIKLNVVLTLFNTSVALKKHPEQASDEVQDRTLTIWQFETQLSIECPEMLANFYKPAFAGSRTAYLEYEHSFISSSTPVAAYWQDTHHEQNQPFSGRTFRVKWRKVTWISMAREARENFWGMFKISSPSLPTQPWGSRGMEVRGTAIFKAKRNLVSNNRKILYLPENWLLRTESAKTEDYVIQCLYTQNSTRFRTCYQNHDSCSELRVIYNELILIFAYPRSFLLLE